MKIISCNADMVLIGEVWLILVGVGWLQRCERYRSYLSDAQ
jgi:hypothetical protein